MTDEVEPQSFELSLSEKFDQQRFLRLIDECNDIDQMRQIAKSLLGGWYAQRAASKWFMKQTLPVPSKIVPTLK